MLSDQLSQMDVVFLGVESARTPMHTAGVVIFEGKIPFSQVYETVESRLHLVPRFTQKLAMVPFGLGRPFWADDPQFDLSYHLRHAALPSPGSDEQLCDFAARLISRQLDRSKPLWEVYVIEGLEDGRSAIVAKTHHAMVDGLSSMDLATVLFDFSREPPKAPKGEVRKTSSFPSSFDRVQAAIEKQVSEINDVSKLVRTAVSAPGKIIEAVTGNAGSVVKAFASVAKRAPSSPLNVGPGLHRRFAVVRSTLQTFKDIKNAAGATVNDVVLSVCADSLGKLMRFRGERTEGVTLKALVPVSVRTEDQRGGLGNEITAIFPELPIGKMGALDRLGLIHEQLDGIKDSEQAVGAERLVNATRWAPPTLHMMAARLGARARIMNVTISNVPGPQMPLYSCGVKMLEPYAVIPLAESQSLSIGVTSYNEGIFFGLNADRDSHPDLAQLASYIDESIRDLAKAAAEATSEAITTAETEIAVGSVSGSAS